MPPKETQEANVLLETKEKYYPSSRKLPPLNFGAILKDPEQPQRYMLKYVYHEGGKYFVDALPEPYLKNLKRALKASENSVEEITKSILYSIALDMGVNFKSYRRHLEQVISQINTSNNTIRRNVFSHSLSNKDSRGYYQIDVSALIANITSRMKGKKLEDGMTIPLVNTQWEFLGHVTVKEDTLNLCLNDNAYKTCIKDCGVQKNLNITSTGVVKIESPLSVKNVLHITANAIDCRKGANIIAKQANLHCNKEYRHMGTLRCENMSIRAGFSNISGSLEAVEKDIIITTERLNVSGEILAKEKLVVNALDIELLQKSQLHGLKLIHCNALNVNAKGVLSTKNFLLNGRALYLDGTIYSEENTKIILDGEIISTKKGRFFVKGPADIHTKNRFEFPGVFRQHNEMSVSWRKIYLPKKIFQEDRLSEKSYEKISIIPVDTWNIIPHKQEQSAVNFKCLGDMDFSGAFIGKNANLVFLAENELQFSGFTEHFGQEQYLSRNLVITDGFLYIKGTLQSQSTNSTKIVNSTVKASGNVQFHSTDITFEEGSKIDAHNISVQAKKTAHIQEGAVLSAEQIVAILGEKIRFLGEIESKTAILKAQKFLLSCGSYNCEDILWSAPFIVNGISRNKVTKKFTTITAKKSITANSAFHISFGLISSKVYNNTSFFSLDLGAFIQKGVNMAVSPVTLALVVVNIAAMTATLLVPGVGIFVIPIQMGINGLIRLYFGEKMIEDIIAKAKIFNESDTVESRLNLANSGIRFLVSLLASFVMMEGISAFAHSVGAESATDVPSTELPPTTDGGDISADSSTIQVDASNATTPPDGTEVPLQDVTDLYMNFLHHTNPGANAFPAHDPTGFYAANHLQANAHDTVLNNPPQSDMPTVPDPIAPDVPPADIAHIPQDVTDPSSGLGTDIPPEAVPLEGITFIEGLQRFLNNPYVTYAEQVLANLMILISGKNTVSVFSISVGATVGASTTYSLFSANFRFDIQVVNVETSLVHVSGGEELNLGISSITSIWDKSLFGGTLSPFGRENHHALQSFTLSNGNGVLAHYNVETKTFTLHKANLNKSSIKAENTNVSGEVELLQSLIDIEKNINVDKDSTLVTAGCSVKAEQLNVAEGGEYVGAAGKVEINQVNNDGVVAITSGGEALFDQYLGQAPEKPTENPEDVPESITEVSKQDTPPNEDPKGVIYINGEPTTMDELNANNGKVPQKPSENSEAVPGSTIDINLQGTQTSEDNPSDQATEEKVPNGLLYINGKDTSVDIATAHLQSGVIAASDGATVNIQDLNNKDGMISVSADAVWNVVKQTTEGYGIELYYNAIVNIDEHKVGKNAFEIADKAEIKSNLEDIAGKVQLINCNTDFKIVILEGREVKPNDLSSKAHEKKTYWMFDENGKMKQFVSWDEKGPKSTFFSEYISKYKAEAEKLSNKNDDSEAQEVELTGGLWVFGGNIKFETLTENDGSTFLVYSGEVKGGHLIQKNSELALMYSQVEIDDWIRMETKPGDAPITGIYSTLTAGKYTYNGRESTNILHNSMPNKSQHPRPLPSALQTQTPWKMALRHDPSITADDFTVNIGGNSQTISDNRQNAAVKNISNEGQKHRHQALFFGHHRNRLPTQYQEQSPPVVELNREDSILNISNPGNLLIEGKINSAVTVEFSGENVVFKGNVVTNCPIIVKSEGKTYFYHAEIYLGGSGEITSKKNVELYKSHMFVSGGLTINTDQDFVNTASFITLVDDLVIVAKRDVHMETTVHYEKIKEHGHHSKTTGKIPVFEMAGAESKNGSIKITAENGVLNLKGTSLKAAGTIELEGFKGVYLGNVIGTVEVTVKEHHTHGLSYEYTKTTFTDDINCSTTIEAKGVVTIKAENGGVEGTATVIKGQKVYIYAKEKVHFEKAILDHSVKQSSWSVSIKSSVYDAKNPKSQLPGYSEYMQVLNAHGLAENIIAGMNVLPAAINMIATALEAGNDLKGSVKDYAQNKIDNELVTAGVNHSKVDMTYQTLSEGEMVADEIVIVVYDRETGSIVMSNAYTLDSDNITYDSRYVEFSGAKLQSSYHSSDMGVNLTAGVKGVSSVGGDVSYSTSSSTTHVNSEQSWKSANFVNVVTFVVDGGDIKIEKADGSIKILSVNGRLNKNSSKSMSIGGSSTGNVHGSYSQSKGTNVVTSSVNFGKDSSVEVDKVEAKGSKVQGVQANSEVNQSMSGSSTGFSASVSANFGEHDSGKPFSNVGSINVSKDTSHEKTNENGDLIQHKKHFETELNIRTLNRASYDKFIENAKRAASSVSASVTNAMHTLTGTNTPVDNITGFENTAAEAALVNTLQPKKNIEDVSALSSIEESQREESIDVFAIPDQDIDNNASLAQDSLAGMTPTISSSETPKESKQSTANVQLTVDPQTDNDTIIAEAIAYALENSDNDANHDNTSHPTASIHLGTENDNDTILQAEVLDALHHAMGEATDTHAESEMIEGFFPSQMEFSVIDYMLRNSLLNNKDNYSLAIDAGAIVLSFITNPFDPSTPLKIYFQFTDVGQEQLAAMIQPIKDFLSEYSVGTRALGAMEMAVGIGLLRYKILGKDCGKVFLGLGYDKIQAGFRQLITGEHVATEVDKAIVRYTNDENAEFYFELGLAGISAAPTVARGVRVAAGLSTAENLIENPDFLKHMVHSAHEGIHLSEPPMLVYEHFGEEHHGDSDDVCHGIDFSKVVYWSPGLYLSSTYLEEPIILYRGDSRPPEEIFAEGFKAKGVFTGTTEEIYYHLISHGKSGLIGTSWDKDSAAGFPKIQGKTPEGFPEIYEGEFYPREFYVYKINGVWGIDAAAEAKAILESGKYPYFTEDDYKMLAAEKEIAVRGSIPANRIEGYVTGNFEFDDSGNWVEFKEEIHGQLHKLLIDEDLMVNSDYARIISTDFIKNPKYTISLVEGMELGIKTLGGGVALAAFAYDIKNVIDDWQEYGADYGQKRLGETIMGWGYSLKFAQATGKYFEGPLTLQRLFVVTAASAVSAGIGHEVGLSTARELESNPVDSAVMTLLMFTPLGTPVMIAPYAADFSVWYGEQLIQVGEIYEQQINQLMTEEERNRLYPMPGGVAMSAQETALLEKSMGAALIKVAEFVKYILHMPGNVAPNTQEVWQQELENRKEYNVKFFSTDMSSPFFKSYSRSAPQVANTDIPTAPNSEVKTKKFTC